MFRLKDNSGFTLNEILLVVVIICISSAIALPNVIVWLSNYRLKSATMDLFLNLNRAKIEAAKRNKFCTVTFNRSPFDYIIYIDDNKNLECDSGDTIIESIRFEDYKSGIDFDPTYGGGDGLTFADNDLGQPSVAFNPVGLPLYQDESLAPGLIVIKNNRDKKKQLTINSTGMIKISII